MIIKVVGVTFSNEDGSSRSRIIESMSKNDYICLERDPYNQFDSNAVKVCVLMNGERKQIGFLPKQYAAEISPKMRKNIAFDVKIVDVGVWCDRPYCEIMVEERPSAPKTDSAGVDINPTITSRRVVGPMFNPRMSKSPSFVPPKATEHPNSSENLVAQSNVSTKPSSQSPSTQHTVNTNNTMQNQTNKGSESEVPSSNCNTSSSSSNSVTSSSKSKNTGCIVSMIVVTAIIIIALL